MNECAILAVRWQLAGSSILKAFDDCSFSGAILADNQSERCIKFDNLRRLWAEGADSLDGKSIDR